jgi:3-hydroxy-9,10-secoandrosta-1,3,5(10)-triene-9,17-dione monooxygenase reductase component
MSQVDGRSLRNVLGCYATGVAIMATRTQAGEHVGVTVNSFASVSLDPPLILFSLGKTASVLSHFSQAEFFTVNILAHRQEKLSNGFARPSTAPWASSRYSEAENGCALFAGCVAYLECERYAELDGGDHRILLGRVTQVHLHGTTDPLLFFRGRYGTFVSGAPMDEKAVGDFTVQGWG